MGEQSLDVREFTTKLKDVSERLGIIESVQDKILSMLVASEKKSDGLPHSSDNKKSTVVMEYTNFNEQRSSKKRNTVHLPLKKYPFLEEKIKEEKDSHSENDALSPGKKSPDEVRSATFVTSKAVKKVEEQLTRFDMKRALEKHHSRNSSTNSFASTNNKSFTNTVLEGRTELERHTIKF